MPQVKQLPTVKSELQEGDFIEAFAFKDGRLFACIKRYHEGTKSMQYFKADALGILRRLVEDNQ